MARSIQDFDGTKEPVDSDYPDGDLADKTISTPGTKINRKSNSDIQQFFAKLLRMAKITPNALPDNEYNLFQLVEAAHIFARGGWKVQLMVPNTAQNTTVQTIDMELVTYGPGADPGHNLYLDDTTDDRTYVQARVINNSAQTINVEDNNSGTINGSSSFTLQAYQTRTFYKSGTNWIVG